MDQAALALVVHIFAACLMVGATAVNGLLHAIARRATAPEARPILASVLRVNRFIMGPSLFLLPASGGWLVLVTGHDPRVPWLLVSILLTALLILAFLLGGRLERRLADSAATAAAAGADALPTGYHRVFRQAAPIGAAALVMSIAAIALMVFKPI